MLTGREQDKFAFHASIESAGGKKCADGWAMNFAQCFGLEVGCALGASYACEVVHSMSDS